MNILNCSKWINRHGAAPALFGLLVLLCAAAHATAIGKIKFFSDIPLDTWPPRLVRNMAGIQFFQANWWFPLPYLLMFFGMLVYMEVRATPRWAVWIWFLFMSLPAVGYVMTCMRVSAGFITFMSPVPGLSQPSDVSFRKLKLPVRTTQDLPRRLRRKLAANGYVPASWKLRAEYRKGINH